MHTKESILNQLKQMNIDSKGTIIVHSSMKSIGEVEGGADTILDIFTTYMEEGLLVFPTHTWRDVDKDQPIFDVENTPSHVGILTEKFRTRPGVVRSLHPTHSVAAVGKNAEMFVEGNEKYDTPCARGSSWGKLLGLEAKIILIGVDLKRNTFIHGIEEWMDIPGRLTESREPLQTVLKDGTKIDVPQRRHCGLSWSHHFWKVETLLAEKDAIQYAKLGDAKVLICDAVLLNKYISEMLRLDPDLFSDNEPLTEAFSDEFRRISK